MTRLGPYAILEELGRGAMGVVYKARHDALDRTVALKVVVPGSASAMAIARLRREAQAAARLTEVPGVVAVRDVGEHDGTVYVAMDFIDGRPFDTVIAEGEMAPLHAIELVARAARAVHEAHAHGVLHRDLKPANILIDRDGAPWVADFGLAKMVPADRDVTKLTRSDEILGTPAYMPPEQVNGAACDARSDVYALGATLYQAVTGQLPFVADSVYGVFLKVLRDPPPPPSSLIHALPAGLEPVLMSALAKSPGDRPATAAALADDLDRVLAGRAVRSVVPRSPRRSLRRLVLVAVVLFVGSLVALAAVLAGGARKLSTAEQAGVRAQLAADLPQIYLDLVRKSGDAMATLEDRWNQVRVPDGEVSAALDVVRAAAAANDDGRPALRLPRAWRALGEAYATPGSDGIARLTALAGPSDPYPSLFAARLALAGWASETSAPEFTLTSEGYEPQPVAQTPEAEALRLEAQRLVRRATSHPLFATLPGADNYRALLDAGSDFVAVRHADAVPKLTPLLLDPLLAGVAAPMLGLAHLNAGAPGRAAAAWEDRRVERWPAVQHNAVLAHLAAAAVASGAGGTALPRLDRARDRADHLVGLAPERPAWREVRLRVWFARTGEGDVVAALTADDYRRVIADIEVLEVAGGFAALAAEWRTELNLLYVQLEDAAPAARPEMARRVEASLAHWESVDAQNSRVHAERARWWGIQVTLAEGAGRPVRAARAEAAAAWARAVALDSTYVTAMERGGVAYTELGEHCQEAGDLVAAQAAFEHARDLFSRWHALAPRDPEPLINRGVAHRLVGDVAELRGEPADAHYRASLADGRAAVTLAPTQWRPHSVVAVGHAKLTEWSEAERALGAGLQCDPGNEFLEDLLGQVRRIQGK